MKRYFLRALGTHFRAGRTLFFLAVFGVALGVASVLSIQIINRNALGAFEGGLRAVSGEADLTVFGLAPALREEIYPAVLAEPGVAAAWPLVRADVALGGRRGRFLEIVGLDLFAPLRLPWQVAPDGIAAALSTPGWVALTPALAAEMGWKVGDSFAVTSGSRRARLRVGALVDFHRITPLASRRLAVMDIAQAQDLFGRQGEIGQIDVQAAPGEDRAKLAARLRLRLGDAYQVVTPEQREKQAAGLLGAFRLNLTALSFISLFVGCFLVYTSTQAALVRRRAEFGLLRSLGTTRGQIVALVLGEVLLLGVLGVGLGIPIGYRVAEANVKTVSDTLSNLYLLQAIETLTLSPGLCLLAACIGIGGAFAGALLPAIDMSRREPRALLAAYTLHERIGSSALPLFLLGLALAGGSGLFYALVLRDWRPGGFVVGIGILLALPLITPFLLRLACRSVRLGRGRFGVLYGFKSLGLRLQTTAFAAGALAVAASMLIGITLMIGSFRKTLEIWVASTVQADIYISTESWARGRSEATISDDLVAAIRRIPGVHAMDRLRQFMVQAGGRRVALSGVDLGLEGASARFVLMDGEPRAVLRRAREENGVLIGEPLARKGEYRVGERLPLAGPRGPLLFPIAGVYYDYASENGSIVIDLKTMAEAFGPGPINNLALYLEPGINPEQAVDDLKARFKDAPLVIRSNRRLREEIISIFDQTFAVTRLLQAMSLLIAVSGITLTLLVLARERVSELALYRALGATRPQIVRIFMGKGVGMALFGLALGLLGGIALAMVLIFLINRAYFGWTIAVHWPWPALLRDMGTILLAAALASLYPALRASRTPATELDRDDL